MGLEVLKFIYKYFIFMGTFDQGIPMLIIFRLVLSKKKDKKKILKVVILVLF